MAICLGGYSRGLRAGVIRPKIMLRPFRWSTVVTVINGPKHLKAGKGSVRV